MFRTPVAHMQKVLIKFLAGHCQKIESGHRHRWRCCRHRHSVTGHLSPEPGHSGVGLCPLIPVPDCVLLFWSGLASKFLFILSRYGTGYRVFSAFRHLKLLQVEWETPCTSAFRYQNQSGTADHRLSGIAQLCKKLISFNFIFNASAITRDYLSLWFSDRFLYYFWYLWLEVPFW